MLPGLRTSPVDDAAGPVSQRKQKEVRYRCPECGISRGVAIPTRESDEELEAFLARVKRAITYDHMTSSPACLAQELEGPYLR